MSRNPGRRSEIEKFIIELIAEQSGDVARAVAERFGVSRQAAGLHLHRMVERGDLVAEGETRGRRYRLRVQKHVQRTYDLSGPTATIAEDRVWADDVLPILSDVASNVRDICHYGLTEMVNNALDHSNSPTMLVDVSRTASRIELEVYDRGVGIFRKIREAYGLEDDRHAIFELTKGKLTTDPKRHTGEGIFFTSRMFDEFHILSGGLSLSHRRDATDWLIESRGAATGTRVSMSIRSNSTHTDKEVFERYASEQDDYAFNRTHVVVNLARSEGENLVSRSQAKRLLARLERFREIVLDFRGVDSIGPAFADEIFRVFRSAHPGSRLTPANTTDDVARMIRRALAAETS